MFKEIIMWFLPDVTKRAIPDVIYKAQEKYEEYAKLADALIEQHPIFARMVADRFDKYPFTPFKHKPIVPKEASYGNKVVWTNAPLDFPMGISTMCGI